MMGASQMGASQTSTREPSEPRFFAPRLGEVRGLPCPRHRVPLRYRLWAETTPPFAYGAPLAEVEVHCPNCDAEVQGTLEALPVLGALLMGGAVDVGDAAPPRVVESMVLGFDRTAWYSLELQLIARAAAAFRALVNDEE